MKPSDIVLEMGNYFAIRVKNAKGKVFYEIYKNGATHSTRCAIIGSFADGSEFDRIRREIARRMGELK